MCLHPDREPADHRRDLSIFAVEYTDISYGRYTEVNDKQDVKPAGASGELAAARELR